MNESNTRIWDAIERTDPRFQKNFQRGGGFRGTAINPTYVARKLTEQFGPCGMGWGFRVIEEKYVEGAPLSLPVTAETKHGEASTSVERAVVREVIHVVLVEFWYVDPDDMEVRKIYQYGQTTFVGKDKNGLFTDEEAPKKSITDGWTKAATLLGCSADIYLGGLGFGDNKYVNDRTAGEGPENPCSPGQGLKHLATKALEEAEVIPPPPPPGPEQKAAAAEIITTAAGKQFNPFQPQEPPPRPKAAPRSRGL